MLHPNAESRCRHGEPAGLYSAKSADLENPKAVQHNAKQRPQSARRPVRSSAVSVVCAFDVSGRSADDVRDVRGDEVITVSSESRFRCMRERGTRRRVPSGGTRNHHRTKARLTSAEGLRQSCNVLFTAHEHTSGDCRFANSPACRTMRENRVFGVRNTPVTRGRNRSVVCRKHPIPKHSVQIDATSRRSKTGTLKTNVRRHTGRTRT